MTPELIEAREGAFFAGGRLRGVSFERRDEGGVLRIGGVPSDGERGPAADSLACAAQWAYDLDDRVRVSVDRGRVVERTIRAADPTPLPSRVEAGADTYRRYRQPAATMIRPLLCAPASRSHLFQYQVVGVDWLKEQEAGILADDMGLGKTLQAITALRELVAEGAAKWVLIVCPRSLIATWEVELSKWAPELTRLRVVPSARERAAAWGAVIGRVHVLITNFEQVRSAPESLSREHIPLLVADEAHRIRNADSGVTVGMRRLRADRFWALTGTPMERDAEDLATLLSLVDRRRFAPSDAALPLSVLRARARPMVLRRKKEEVLDELPDVIEREERLDLTAEQAHRYQGALRRLTAAASTRDDTLRLLNELRQICDFDPESGASTKLDRIVELLDEISDVGEKAVVFSTLVEPLRLLKKRLDAAGFEAELLIGELAFDDREAAVARFRTDQRRLALLASTWIAGEGLTLVEANHVIFFNEWWNPSTNAQARDRVVRIGQTKGVNVYRFISRGTVEEALARVLARKKDLFAGLVDELSQQAEPDPGLVSEVVQELRLL